MASVVDIWRYPVKSMAGERMQQCAITEKGLEGDRRWAFIDRSPNRDGKFLTIRQHEDLLRYRSRIVDGAVEVEARGGSLMTMDESLLDRLRSETSRPLELRDDAGANYDDSQVLIINLASIELLGREAGTTLDRRRFRANLYVDGLEPEEELAWLGQTISAGDARLEVVKRDERCVVITRDPETTVATPELLRLLAERHDQCMGVYCRVVKPGRVRVGDVVG
ncbi:MAG TPA: MOSC N-terminal beta barrel domain-containing protein [Candidatus Dormibacteraeota bacterium]|nr:MOSC N-terminal beta barrel domain-containing protein [Candidatus Dormibacteraeota bacterium]